MLLRNRGGNGAENQQDAVTVGVGDVPDVTVATTPVRQLQALVDECGEALKAYSRIIAKDPAKRESLDALASLPIELWSPKFRTAMDSLVGMARVDFVAMPFAGLAERFGGNGSLTRASVGNLTRMLAGQGLGVEPDVLGGARTPKPDDAVVVFHSPGDAQETRATASYQVAAITLDLATAVAAVDGDATGEELQHLSRHIDSWAQLSIAHRTRLKAHLRRALGAPPTLASVKKRLDPVAPEAKRALSRFLAHLAQVDGSVSPSEVKLLEKVYKVLGVDAQELYSDLHGASAAATTARIADVAGSKERAAFDLDPARIATLQQETAEVSRLLAAVFVEDDAPPEVPRVAEDESESEDVCVLGLDATHSAFLRMLMSRKSWARAELLDLASDMELMLDGAIERVNDATIEQSGGVLLEGDDPIELNHEVMETLPL